MLLFLHRDDPRNDRSVWTKMRRDATPRRAAPSSTKRKRLKLKATVKNDGTLPREKTRAFIVRDSLVHFTSLLFLFISCPSSLSPCVFKSCLKYPLRDTSSFFTYIFILERDWSSIDENYANSEKWLFRMKKKGWRRTLSQIQSRANCVYPTRPLFSNTTRALLRA